MTLRRLVRVLALLAVVLVTAWLFSPKQPQLPAFVPGVETPPAATSSAPAASVPPPTSPPHPVATPGTSPSALPPVLAALPSTPPPAVLPTDTPAAAAAPANSTAIALDQVRLMLRDYRTLNGENPVGTNAEIMRTLMGDNPRQATLGPPEGQSLNDHGELVDPWNTPLFFHQLSRTVMEIRSAGPDRTMWTEDDIVTR